MRESPERHAQPTPSPSRSSLPSLAISPDATTPSPVMAQYSTKSLQCSEDHLNLTTGSAARLWTPRQALFNIGDLTLSLYESELAIELLPNKITDLSSLSNSGEARLLKLNRAENEALFNIGDLTPSLYENELAIGLLPNKIMDLSSLLNSGEAGSPKLNRAENDEKPRRLNIVNFGDLITKIHQSPSNLPIPYDPVRYVQTVTMPNALSSTLSISRLSASSFEVLW